MSRWMMEREWRWRTPAAARCARLSRCAHDSRARRVSATIDEPPPAATVEVTRAAVEPPRRTAAAGERERSTRELARRQIAPDEGIERAAVAELGHQTDRHALLHDEPVESEHLRVAHLGDHRRLARELIGERRERAAAEAAEVEPLDGDAIAVPRPGVHGAEGAFAERRARRTRRAATTKFQGSAPCSLNWLLLIAGSTSAAMAMSAIRP